MKESLPVVLASASPARKNLLIQAGVNPTVMSANLNESALFNSLKDKTPQQIVAALAEAKAQAVIATNELPLKGLLIAADSMWEFKGELVGKPKDRTDAKKRISEMSANSGTLHTGHFVMNLASRRFLVEVVSTVVHIDQITDGEIDDYLATEEPLAVAGSFTLNGYGAAYVKSVQGDSNNVIGLSINTVKTLTHALGLNWSATWNQIS